MESEKSVNHHLEGLSDETFDLLCSPCKAKNRSTEAQKYCVDCRDHYCYTCVKCHEDIPALARHKILDKEEFETLVRQELPPLPTERCKRHKHKLIDMYCQAHDYVGCSACIGVDHSDCQGVFFIPKFLKENRNTIDCQTIKIDLETTTQRLTQLQGDVECHKILTLKRKDETVQKIKKTGDVARERIDKMERDALDDTDVKYKPVLEKINEEMCLIQAAKAEVSSARSNIESAGNNVSQVFVVVKKGQGTVKGAEKYTDGGFAKLQAGAIAITSIHYTNLLKLLQVIESSGYIEKENSNTTGQKKTSNRDQDIIHSNETVEKPNVSMNEACRHGADEGCTSVDIYYPSDDEKRDISTLECEDEHVGQKVYHENAVNTETKKEIGSAATTEAKDNKDTNQNQVELLPATTSTGSGIVKTATDKNKGENYESTSIAIYDRNALKKCNIRIPSDTKDCSVTGICALDDGTLIIADYGNKRLKRVDITTFTVTDYCNLPFQPWQVCSVSKQDVAVSYWGNVTEIQFVSIGGKMAKTKRKETCHGCLGVSCGDGKLYISDTTSVYVYTISGTKIKQFPRDQSVGKIFSNISSLTVSADGSTIYVADSNKGLILLDRNGNVRGKYDGSELQGARGICIVRDGGVMVCGRGSNNVLKFGPRCEKTTQMLKSEGNMAKYQAICCNAKNAKLIVGREDSDDIEILV